MTLTILILCGVLLLLSSLAAGIIIGTTIARSTDANDLDLAITLTKGQACS